MFTSEAVVTSHGGMTSHAAVVARGWGRPAVVGAGDLLIDSAARTASVKGRTGIALKEGDWLSVNGTTGDVFLGRFETVPPTASPHLRISAFDGFPHVPIHLFPADHRSKTTKFLSVLFKLLFDDAHSG